MRRGTSTEEPQFLLSDQGFERNAASLLSGSRRSPHVSVDYDAAHKLAKFNENPGSAHGTIARKAL